VHLQLHGTVGIGGAIEHRAAQARRERLEELHRAQGGLAALAQLRTVVGTGKQALVLTQGVFDLGVAGQGGIVMDAEPCRGLELGLVVIADAALGHQAGGLMRQLVAALTGLRGCMLTGSMHDRYSLATCTAMYTGDVTGG